LTIKFTHEQQTSSPISNPKFRSEFIAEARLHLRNFQSLFLYCACTENLPCVFLYYLTSRLQSEISNFRSQIISVTSDNSHIRLSKNSYYFRRSVENSTLKQIRLNAQLSP